MSAENVTVGMFDCRDAFTKTLAELAEIDSRIVAVVNDSVGSSKLGDFRKRWPERLINVGIAEQNMVGVGAGLANGGKIPFICGASCFLTGRATEQVKVDLAYSHANAKLCGTTCGIAYGELGPTHHSIEDVAWLRTMGNIVVIVPSDPWETAEAVKAAAAYDGPVFIRVSRTPVPAIARNTPRFEIGKAEVLREGADVAIITNGIIVWRALAAAEALERDGIKAKVVNMATVSPIDEEAVLAAAATGAIVTAEEHSQRGGLGSAVAEITATHQPCRQRILGFPGFLPTGTVEGLLERHGLTADGIAAAARDLVGAKNR
jgi:transketolase